ncbi:hypothetical protein [Campylobacter phage vB_CcoM-IBB_35]|uniref:Uncharacterized protein n=1 Tax=Campylobacter virus IBB35 TaxID=1006972 RepID=H6SUL0_9CAUD|nr:hypothetical protein FDG52_s3gp12 [Campylobacter phage vB_CcoM-IBB_35]AEF56841.1 hypothetical protein [Campylobacter phage vB_CcoM-IBB_35]
MRDEFDDLLASLAIEPVKKPEIEYQEPLVVKPTSNIEVNEANKQNTDLNDFSDVLNNIESGVSSTNNNTNNNENIVASSDSEAVKEYIDLRNIKNESDIEVPDLVDTMRLEEAPSLVSATSATSDTPNISTNQTQESKPRGYEVPDIKGTTKRVPDIDDSENNVYKLETEYIDIILSYEEELKDLKRRFKLNTLEYQAKGVQTRLVIKAVKQAAKDAKKEGYIIKDENRIQERINNDSNLLGRICSVINSSI